MHACIYACLCTSIPGSSFFWGVLMGRVCFFPGLFFSHFGFDSVVMLRPRCTIITVDGIGTASAKQIPNIITSYLGICTTACIHG